MGASSIFYARPRRFLITDLLCYCCSRVRRLEVEELAEGVASGVEYLQGTIVFESELLLPVRP
jgi:hypothetical protein